MGVKKTFGRLIGKTRRRAAHEINKSIKSDLDKNEVYNAKAASHYKYSKDLESKLEGEAAKSGAPKIYRFYDNKGPSNGSFIRKNATLEDVAEYVNANKGRSPVVEKEVIRFGKDVIDNGGKADGIVHPPSSSSVNLAHEIGHHLNSKSKNPVARALSARANKESVRTGLENAGNQAKDGVKGKDEPISGLKEMAKRIFDSNLVVREETKATKKGLKLVRKHGDSDLVKDGKEQLGNYTEGYKAAARINWKLPLRNLVQIKSRKRLPVEKDIELWKRKKKK